MFKVNNKNIRTSCKTRSKLTIETPEQRQWSHSGVLIVNIEHIPYLVLSPVSIVNFEQVNANWVNDFLLVNSLPANCFI